MKSQFCRTLTAAISSTVLCIATSITAFAQERCRPPVPISSTGLSSAAVTALGGSFPNYCKFADEADTPMLRARAALEKDFMPLTVERKSFYARWVRVTIDDAFRTFAAFNDYRYANPKFPWKDEKKDIPTPGETNDSETCQKCGEHLYALQMMETRINNQRNRLACAQEVTKAIFNPINKLDNMWRTRSPVYGYTAQERKVVQDYISAFNIDAIISNLMGEVGKSNRAFSPNECSTFANTNNVNTANIIRLIEQSPAVVKLPPNHRLVVIQSDLLRDGRPLCLTVGGDPMLQPCTGHNMQTFSLDPEGRIKDDYGSCLNATRHSPSTSVTAAMNIESKAWFADCSTTRDSDYATWEHIYDAAQGTIRTANKRYLGGCLIVTKVEVGEVARFELCNDDYPTMKWNFVDVSKPSLNGTPNYSVAQPAPRNALFQLESAHVPSKCVEVIISPLAAPSLGLMSCAGESFTSRYFMYNLASQTLSVTGKNLCFETAGKGNAVLTKECVKNNPKQKWQIQGNVSTVRNAADGLCLDVDGWKKDNGTRIISWDCGNNQANQQWSVVQRR